MKPTPILRDISRAEKAIEDEEIEVFAARDRDDTPAEVPPARTAVLVGDVAKLETPPIRSYATGLAELDAAIGGGISTRQLLTVLGPPGAGKSAWAVATAIRIAPTIPVLYASTELEQHELMARVAGNLLDRPWSAIARGDVPKQWVLEALADVRIHLLGCDLLPKSGADALRLIEREAQASATTYGVPPLVIADYLQDLGRGAERDLRARVGDIATDLRAMAQRLDCPVIAVSSVARTYYSPRKAAEMREADDPTVYLAAAKESGDVDYASAVVLFLDVEEAGDGPDRAARIAIAKSRHGQVGFAGARFAGASGRWTSAPDSVGALSAPGRASMATSDREASDDLAVLRKIEKLHADGKRDLCTKSQLRTTCGIAAERVGPTLERLEHAGRLRTVAVDRAEGPRTRTRVVYELVAIPPPPALTATLEMDLEPDSSGLHGGVSWG